MSDVSDSLRAALKYEPQVLRFGTSGRRGEVVHLSQLEIYINAMAELEYLQSLGKAEGGIVHGDDFYFAYDLRPSSTRFVAEQGGRGEMAQAIARAIDDAGMKPVNLGALPTPALTSFALAREKGSMMVTGSHIPFDRNGYKTNSAKGELLKKDEVPINARVERVRERVYGHKFDQSLFDAMGFLKDREALPPEMTEARAAYIRRYTDFFAGSSLKGQRLVVYQHSAVGRDLLVQILESFGAEVIAVGRSDTFVPIDTEAIDAAQLATIQHLVDQIPGKVDAVVSVDGDSDRPLVLGVDENCKVRFFGGDLVGMIVAEHLRVDSVVVPISCNDAVDRGNLRSMVEPKTKIGSPFVIAGMESAVARGRKAVVGWEANGGFLTGSDLVRNGKSLSALPTRDAVLPILSVLFSAAEKNVSVLQLFEGLPGRFSKAALLRKFPRDKSVRIVKSLSPNNSAIADAIFEESGVVALDANRSPITLSGADRAALGAIPSLIQKFFTPSLGFSTVARVNYIDGVRIYFSNGDVAHVRPSGNADEFRIYAVAETQERADAITAAGVAEPDGILRRLERALSFA